MHHHEVLAVDVQIDAIGERGEEVERVLAHALGFACADPAGGEELDLVVPEHVVHAAWCG